MILASFIIYHRAAKKEKTLCEKRSFILQHPRYSCRNQQQKKGASHFGLCLSCSFKSITLHSKLFRLCSNFGIHSYRRCCGSELTKAASYKLATSLPTSHQQTNQSHFSISTFATEDKTKFALTLFFATSG